MSTSTEAGIRILEDRVVDQIAAGEVVERPASVVKELVENSLDADARQIDVILVDGGRALIQVSDDGEGMGEQDALLAIERHATSKIRRVEDLVGVKSFGFRGEALPSIAAVSKFELTTHQRGVGSAGDGTRIRIHGGKLVDVRPAGAAPGTQIRARNLFYNVPARRSFLRATSTELGHCVQVMVRAALSRPDVGFSLTHSGRAMIAAEPTSSVAQRAGDVLGADARRLHDVFEREGDLTLRGLASPPGIHRATGSGAIYLFVNQRWVRDLVLRRAIQQAYRDLVPRGRYPIVVLDLSLPGEGVDVNVHPSKAEVQFKDPAQIGAFVAQGLRKAILELTGRGDTPRSHLHSRARGPTPLPFSATPATPPPHPPLSAIKTGLDVPGNRVGEGDSPTPLPSASPALPAPTAPPAPVAPPGEAPPIAADAPAEQVEEPPVDPLHDVAVLGVVGARWAVGDADGALWMLDVGRLARRVQAARATAPGKRLLAPAVIRLSEVDVQGVEYHADALSQAGVEVVQFSSTEVAIRTLPASLASADPEEVLRTALLALRRGAPVHATWGSRLPPATVPNDPAAVRALLAEAAKVGLPVQPQRLDPAALVQP